MNPNKNGKQLGIQQGLFSCASTLPTSKMNFYATLSKQITKRQYHSWIHNKKIKFFSIILKISDIELVSLFSA